MRQIAGLARHRDAGDLIVMGAVDAKGSVIAFEDQRAAHGGLGGDQTNAFAMLPAVASGSENLDLASLRARLLGMLGRLP